MQALRDVRCARFRWLVPISVCMLIACGAAAQPRALPDYPRESDLLVNTPGTARSVAAGLFNPAAWPMLGQPGMFFAWDDVPGERDVDWTGVLSTRWLGFGVRRFHAGQPHGDELHLDDYTLGIGAGTRAGAWGLSYSWAHGDLDALPRHERLTLGSVSRIRFASLGMASTWDLERRDNFQQADVGIRPLGPRLTLFGDAVYERGQSFSDIRSSYGLEVRPLPGLALSGKVHSTGEFSLALEVGLTPRLDAGMRPHLDQDGDRTASTYALELHPPGPWIGQNFVGRGRAYPEMHLKGGMAYQRYRHFDDRRTLLQTLERINAAADDPRVGGLAVDLSGAAIGAEMQWEVRQALAGLRARGKKVVVYIDYANIFQYALATVADELWIDPEGGLEVLGVSFGRTYMRHALDKLGLGVDEWRFFTYKSAFEGFSRDSMSEPDREQRQALADDFYEEMARCVTSGRRLSRAQWDSIVDEKGVVLPEEARTLGLVDSIGSFEQAKKSARKTSPRTLDDPLATDLAGVAGDPVWGLQEWGEPPRIAVLYAIGECAMDTGIRGRTLSKRIRAAREDRNVKAVVLRADSPGGDALPSDLVAREIRETSKVKPVIVSQGQVAASGGYWISMYGDTIVASPVTITGSIGVIGGWIWNKEFGDKIGFTYDGVKHGAHADLGHGFRLPLLGMEVPDRPPTPEERDRVELLIRDAYHGFVADVARGRGLRESRVDSIGQGRVWSGRRGKDLGLVDELGGLWRSLQIAKQAARIPAARKVEFEEAPDLGSIDLSALRPRIPGLGATGQLAAPADSSWKAEEIIFLRHLLRARGGPLPMLEPFELNDGASRP